MSSRKEYPSFFDWQSSFSKDKVEKKDEFNVEELRKTLAEWKKKNLP